MAKKKSRPKKKEPTKEAPRPATLGIEIKNFVTEIESFAKSLPFVMAMVHAAFEKARQEREAFIDQHCQRGKKPDGTEYFSIQ